MAVVILPGGVAEVMAAADLGLAELAAFIAEDAKRRAHVGDASDPHSGRLRDSIHVVVDPLGVSVIADAPEAIFNEYGTVKMAARPFMTPALASGEAHASVIVGTRMAEVLG